MRLPLITPAKIAVATFIKNFNRYSEKNRTSYLKLLAGMASEDKILKPNPDWTPHYPIIIEVGGAIIIIVTGPTPRPKYTPCEIVLKEAIDKATNFERISTGGIQHLVITAPETKVEIVAMPNTIRRIDTKE